jgi:cytochrome P450
MLDTKSLNSPVRSSSPPPTSKLPSLVQTYLFWRWPHRYLEIRHNRQGSCFTMKPVGLPPSVFFSEEDDIKTILKAPADILYPGAGASVIEPLVGEESFIILDEDAHLAARKAIMPAFYRKGLYEHMAVVVRIVEKETASWPTDRPFASHPYLRALALKVILSTMFDVDDARVAELHSHLLVMLSVTDSLVLQEPQLRHAPGWRRIWRRFLDERKVVNTLVKELLRDGTVTKHGALSLLIDATNPNTTPFTEQQVRDGVMSILLAGHETTASQLAWTFQLIAHDRRVMEELRRESDRGDDVYLKATLQEAMRHRPVFLCTIPRVLQRDFEVAGMTFRPPALFLGCIHLLHHNPNLYSDPQSFIPERFLDTSPSTRAWLPWGGGRKRCPGNHLALFEMLTVLRTVLARWEILPVGRAVETARWRSVIVTPARGSRILLRTRRQISKPESRQSGPAESHELAPSVTASID